MDPRQSLSNRIAFSGLPFGELQRILRRIDAGRDWTGACVESARGFRRLAAAAEAERRARSAADAWLWAAAAYQAASFRAHFEGGSRIARTMLRCRRLARAAYSRAIAMSPGIAKPIQIDAGRFALRGYFRAPYGAARSPLVVLLNGLDSVCEVEMHAFSEWMLARGLATLTLDLPADFGSTPRNPTMESELAAHAIRRWLVEHGGCAKGPVGAFGVSFGGYLAARMLTADVDFRGAVAVSPPAYFEDRELGVERIRRMFALAVDARDDTQLARLAAGARLESLPPPRAPLLHIHMRDDMIFGDDHLSAYRRWAGDALHSLLFDAEHVGTSAYHLWLPYACDWLRQRLSD